MLYALNSWQADSGLVFSMGHMVVLLAERNLADTVDEGAVLVHRMMFRETEGPGVVVDRAEALVSELF